MQNSAQYLFAQTRELPAAKREAFLSEACAGNAEPRLEVERLLVDAGRADSIFGDTAGETRVGTPDAAGESSFSSEKEGDRIGPYKLLLGIGEGGGVRRAAASAAGPVFSPPKRMPAAGTFDFAPAWARHALGLADSRLLTACQGHACCQT
jgi:hypothetical protein